MSRLTLQQATHYAKYWVEFLKPYCTNISIAGSIRRERPDVGDIDIVVVPKVEEVTVPTGDMFNPTAKQRVNLAYTAVMDLAVRESLKWKGKLDQDGVPPKPDCKFMWLVTPKCELDLWFAEPHNLTSRYLCRTGSMQHNIWIARRAERLGMKWRPYEGLFRQNEEGHWNSCPDAELTEELFYRELRMDFVPPQDRELYWLTNNYGAE